jgi:3-oxoacyl-[acyl-carrier protein] reductase
MEPRGINPSGPAKAALHLWAKSVSREVAKDGVTINTIPPGRINSEQIEKRLHPTEESKQAFIARNVPIGYFGDPMDIGYLAAFLASPKARYITGDVIPVDGGMHFYSH